MNRKRKTGTVLQRKIMWGMMSYRAVSDLHFVPVGQTVTADYYINEILGNLIEKSDIKGDEQETYF